MDELARWEWRNRLFEAYGYIAPAILLGIAAWLGWGRLRYDLIREALVIWPAIAVAAGLAGSALVQPYGRVRSSLVAGLGPKLIAGIACWLVAWEQPVAGIYMSATLAGWAVAASLQKAALRTQEVTALTGSAPPSTRPRPRR